MRRGHTSTGHPISQNFCFFFCFFLLYMTMLGGTGDEPSQVEREHAIRRDCRGDHHQRKKVSFLTWGTVTFSTSVVWRRKFPPLTSVTSSPPFGEDTGGLDGAGEETSTT